MTGKTVPGTAAEGAATTVNDEAVKQAEAKALADERSRVSGLRAAFEPFGNDHDKLLNQCIDDGTSIADAQAKLLEAIGKGTGPIADGRVEIGETEKDKYKAGVTRALLVRSGLEKRDHQTDNGNQFMSYSLLEMARAALIMNGKVPMGDKMNIVAQAFTTTDDFTHLLADVANKAMLMGYEEAPETFQLWTRRGSLSDFKVANRTAMSLFSDLGEVPENGEFKMGTFSDVNEQIQLLTYGKLFPISRQAIINDDLDAFSAIPRRMGRAARRKVGDLAYTVLTANAAMADGVALFHANHSNLGTTGAIASGTISELKKLAALQTDPSGNGILNIMLKYLIVPRAIEDTALAFFASEYNPAEGSTTSFRQRNIHMNTMEVISDGRLDQSSATAYYGVADPNVHDTVEVAYLDGNEAPFLDQQTGWNVDGVTFKVRIDAAAKALDHRAMTKNAGA